MENYWDIKKEVGHGPFPETIVSPMDRAEMVLVPKGPFTMGITEEELQQISILDQRLNPVFATEIPAETVDLDAYYMDRYPVTNYQYRLFVEDTGHREPYLWDHPLWGQPMQPVVFVGWDDARAYAKWAGKSLPDEQHGRRPAVEPTVVCGHGAMNLSLADVIQENTVWSGHRKSAFLTKG